MSTKTIRTAAATTTVALSILVGAGAAAANPCLTDRAFAEANGCNDVFEANHLDVQHAGLETNGSTAPGRVR